MLSRLKDKLKLLLKFVFLHSNSHSLTSLNMVFNPHSITIKNWKLSLFLILIIHCQHSLCAQTNTAPVLSYHDSDVLLKSIFKNYEIISLDIDQIKSSLNQRTVHQKLDIQLGSKHWNLDLFEYDLIKTDYQLRIGTDEGIIIKPKSGNIKTYRISNQNSAGEMGSLTISDHFFYGFVMDGHERYFFEPLSGIDSSCTLDYLIVYKESDVKQNGNLMCGSKELKDKTPIINENTFQNRGTCVAFDVALANDFTVFTFRGDVPKTEAWCTGVLANVQTNYDNEFTVGIELNVSTIFIATSSASDPWNGINDIQVHLNQHATWANAGGYGGASYGLATAWTRKYQSGTIGYAYIGTVCGNLRYNVCSDLNAASTSRNLQAHEMGHNFSANHDAGGSPYIMAPTISGSNIWSAISITAISAHAQSRGCAGGCSTGNNPPIANFKATPTILCVPAMSQVQFMDLSSGNPISWLWSFPGGTPSTSTLQHPLITYSNHGKFEVTLQVTNAGGINAITFLEYIDVEEKPKPSWQHTILNRELTIFPNTSQYADTYLWKFGDGGTSTDAEPKHTYANDGAYDLSLEVTNRCGTVKKTIRIFIVTKNSANFIGDVLRGCTTHKVKYTNQSSTNSTSYLWEFPGGNPSSSNLKDPPVISYPNKGNFDVQLIASNSKYKDTLLRKKYIIADTIPIALFSFTPPIGPLVDFTSLSINELAYFWNFGDGQTSTEKNPSHQYKSAGIYSVILQTSNTCGISRDTQHIEIKKILSADFNVSKSAGCAPFEVNFENLSTNAISMEWKFPGGSPNTSTDINPKVYYSTPGEYDVELIIINGSDRDSIIKTHYIEVRSQPIPDFNYNVSGLQVFFTNTSLLANTYEWDFGDQSAISHEVSPKHEYQSEGIFQVKLKITNDCGTQELMKEVVVYYIPKVDFRVSSTTVCQSDEVQFYDASSKDVNSFEWQIEGATPNVSTLINPTVIFKKTGTYSVKLAVKNSNGSSFVIKQNYINVVSPIYCPERPNKKKKFLITDR